MAKAVKLFAGFTMDFTADTMAAIRADGAVFTRMKGRTHYGYAWSRWRAVNEVPSNMNEISANDACVNHQAYFTDGKPNIRLPN